MNPFQERKGEKKAIDRQAPDREPAAKQRPAIRRVE